ncbi:MAG: hypothetical protein SNI45_00800 [Rikenellaceae bacterium]
MKDFDLKKIGKEMPYKAPSEDFFADTTDQILSRVEKKRPKVFTLRRVLAPAFGVAASLAVIISLTFALKDDAQWNNEYLISDNLDESLDAYFGTLSDEELTYLASQSSYHDDFYDNLPNI